MHEWEQRVTREQQTYQLRDLRYESMHLPDNYSLHALLACKLEHTITRCRCTVHSLLCAQLMRSTYVEDDRHMLTACMPMA